MAHSQFSHFIPFLSGKTTRQPPYNAELCSSEILSGLAHAVPVLFCCGTGGLLVWAGHCENTNTKQPLPFPGGSALSNVIELHELSEALSISQDQTSNANQLVLQHLLGTFQFSS